METKDFIEKIVRMYELVSLDGVVIEYSMDCNSFVSIRLYGSKTRYSSCIIIDSYKINKYGSEKRYCIGVVKELVNNYLNVLE